MGSPHITARDSARGTPALPSRPLQTERSGTHLSQLGSQTPGPGRPVPAHVAGSTTRGSASPPARGFPTATAEKSTAAEPPARPQTASCSACRNAMPADPAPLRSTHALMGADGAPRGARYLGRPLSAGQPCRGTEVPPPGAPGPRGPPGSPPSGTRRSPTVSDGSAVLPQYLPKVRVPVTPAFERECGRGAAAGRDGTPEPALRPGQREVRGARAAGAEMRTGVPFSEL